MFIAFIGLFLDKVTSKHENGFSKAFLDKKEWYWGNHILNVSINAYLLLNCTGDEVYFLLHFIVIVCDAVYNVGSTLFQAWLIFSWRCLVWKTCYYMSSWVIHNMVNGSITTGIWFIQWKHYPLEKEFTINYKDSNIVRICLMLCDC